MLYERFELTKDRLQSVYNFQDARWKLIQKWYDNDIMETDEDEKDKKINENKTHKESQYFERIRDKLNKGSLNFKDNEYLNQLAFVQKKGYVNREREINPGAHVPAPANPNGNIISTFKYANTNDTLPKWNSIEQFNKEIDEKAQYMLNNPNGNNRKRTYIEAFEVYEDQYSEPAEDYAAKYNKYNDYVVNKRRKVISDDEDDEDEEMKEIPQNDKVDLSKFIKKSDMVIPEIPKKEPTPIWTKPSDLKSPSKEGNAYKVYKDNPIEKIAGGFNNQYNTFQNKEIAAPPVRNYRESHTPNTKGYYQQEPEYNDQRSNYSKNYKEKRAGSVKLSECDDDFFYKNKQQNPDSKNPRTGDKYIDDANSGKGFVSAEKQFTGC